MKRFVKELERAVTYVGFFYVKNFNTAQDQIDKMVSFIRDPNQNNPRLDQKAKCHSDETLRESDRNDHRSKGSIV